MHHHSLHTTPTHHDIPITTLSGLSSRDTNSHPFKRVGVRATQAQHTDNHGIN
jgi:hypothetical protein